LLSGASGILHGQRSGQHGQAECLALPVVVLLRDLEEDASERAPATAVCYQHAARGFDVEGLAHDLAYSGLITELLDGDSVAHPLARVPRSMVMEGGDDLVDEIGGR
jgi:hypothetical protein